MMRSRLMIAAGSLVLLIAVWSGLVNERTAGAVFSPIPEAEQTIQVLPSFTPIPRTFTPEMMDDDPLPAQSHPTSVPTEIVPDAELTVALSTGEPVTFMLRAGQHFAQFSFEASAGEVVIFEIIDQDAQLYVDFAPFVVRSLHEWGVRGNQEHIIIQRRVYLIPETAAYVIRLAGYFDDGDTHQTEHTLRLLRPRVNPLVSGQPDAAQVTVDEPIRVYRFTAEAGTWITAYVDNLSSDLRVVLAGRRFPGQVVGPLVNDQALYDPFEYNPSLEPYPIQTTGEYTLILIPWDYTDNLPLSFTHRLYMLTPGDIAYGEQVSGVLTPQLPAACYRFDGEAGDLIVASVTAHDLLFDTTLMLLDTLGGQHGYNDDSGPGLNPELFLVTLPEVPEYFWDDDEYPISDRGYVLCVRGFTGSEAGEFRLALRHEQANKLTSAPLIVYSAAKVSITPYVFDVVPGQHYRLHVRLLSGISLPEIIISQSLDQLLYFYGARFREATLSFIPNSALSGRINLTFGGYDSPSVVELRLEVVEDE